MWPAGDFHVAGSARSRLTRLSFYKLRKAGSLYRVSVEKAFPRALFSWHLLKF